MCRRKFILWLAAAAIVVMDAAGTAQVLAGGYWNMPGTIAQRKGHGFSGGYHAPFILGPIRADGWGAPNEVRLPCAPAPYCGYAGDCECCQMMATPSKLEGVVSPPVPAPAAVRPVQMPAVAPAEASASVDVVPPVSPQKPLFDPPVQP